MGEKYAESGRLQGTQELAFDVQFWTADSSSVAEWLPQTLGVQLTVQWHEVGTGRTFPEPVHTQLRILY